MKKSILFMPVLISLSIVGCTMNYNQPSSDKVIHQSSLNIDKLINANAADVEKSLGSPYYATYYIDADKLKSKNINSISIEDLKEDVSLLASYNDNQSSNSYLHIYYEDGVVKDALYGPYKIDNLDNVISASNISNADYKVSFFKNRGAICYNDFSIDIAKKEFSYKEHMKNSRKLVWLLIISSIIMWIILYPFYKVDIIATLIIVGIELICMYLYPFYITKLTFVQMEYSAMKATISKQIANTLRIFCSFIASPFCTSIGLAVSAIYQLVSMQYIISKNKLNMEMKL